VETWCSGARASDLKQYNPSFKHPRSKDQARQSHINPPKERGKRRACATSSSSEEHQVSREKTAILPVEIANESDASCPSGHAAVTS
jgi:hypothetical protein